MISRPSQSTSPRLPGASLPKPDSVPGLSPSKVEAAGSSQVTRVGSKQSTSRTPLPSHSSRRENPEPGTPEAAHQYFSENVSLEMWKEATGTVRGYSAILKKLKNLEEPDVQKLKEKYPALQELEPYEFPEGRAPKRAKRAPKASNVEANQKSAERKYYPTGSFWASEGADRETSPGFQVEELKKQWTELTGDTVDLFYKHVMSHQQYYSRANNPRSMGFRVQDPLVDALRANSDPLVVEFAGKMGPTRELKNRQDDFASKHAIKNSSGVIRHPDGHVEKMDKSGEIVPLDLMSKQNCAIAVSSDIQVPEEVKAAYDYFSKNVTKEMWIEVFGEPSKFTLVSGLRRNLTGPDVESLKKKFPEKLKDLQSYLHPAVTVNEQKKRATRPEKIKVKKEPAAYAIGRFSASEGDDRAKSPATFLEEMRDEWIKRPGENATSFHAAVIPSGPYHNRTHNPRYVGIGMDDPFLKDLLNHTDPMIKGLAVKMRNTGGTQNLKERRKLFEETHSIRLPGGNIRHPDGSITLKDGGATASASSAHGHDAAVPASLSHPATLPFILPKPLPAAPNISPALPVESASLLAVPSAPTHRSTPRQQSRQGSIGSVGEPWMDYNAMERMIDAENLMRTPAALPPLPEPELPETP